MIGKDGEILSNLAIITARGGSKRIPRKNIKLFCGQPIIKYSIQSALNSNIFDVVMVSTDDKEIAEIARGFGAEVPFFRNEDTSNDYATTADVLFEVLEKYREQGKCFNQACVVYPTAPFINSSKLQKAELLLQDNDAESIIPVVQYSFPPQRGLYMHEGLIKMVQPEHLNTRSQDLEKTYHDCGQFYFVNVESFYKQRKLIMNKTIGIEMNELEVQDIDNEMDWKLAELKYKLMIGVL